MLDREIVRALVSAFNVHNYARNTVKTNFTLQSRGEKDCIVVSFDKGMEGYQYSEYLYNIKRKVVGEFYGIEEGDTDEVVLNTAELIFDVKSFPFNNYKGFWSTGEHGRIEFVAPADEGVIFNLKSHLASSLVKDVLEDMPTCSIVTNSFNKEKYLCHCEFDNKQLRKKFEREFLSRMENRYGYRNVFKNPLKIEGNSVYIKDVFDDARFIDSVTRYIAWLKGMGLQDDSKNYSKVKAFKDLIIEFIDQSTGLTVAGFIRNFPLNEKTAKILIPVVLDNGEPRILANEEALKLSYAFNYAVFNNLYSKVQAELPINGDSGVYGIDFSDPYISHCVITKIIESSVINERHELSIDPELHFRALSRSPSTEAQLPEASQVFPTRDQSEVKESPRQGLVSVLPLNPLDVPGTSGEFSPRIYISSATIKLVVSEPSSSLQSVSAAQNVPAGTSAWSSPASSAGSRPPIQVSSSEPSSSKGADRWGTSDNVNASQYQQKYTTATTMTLPLDGDSSTSYKVETQLSLSPTISDKNMLELSGKSSAPLAQSKNLENYENRAMSESPEKYEDPSFKRSNEGRDSMSSSASAPVSPVNEGIVISQRSASVPVTKRTKINSSKRPQLPQLTEGDSDSSQRDPSIFNKFVRNFLCPNLSPKKHKKRPQESTDVTAVGAGGGLNRQTRLNSDQRKELRSCLCSEMQKKLDFRLYPLHEERWLYLLYVNKRELRLLLSSSEGVEQVRSVLPPEEMEQVQLDSPQEMERLLHKFFSTQKFIDNIFTSSKIDCPKAEQQFSKEKVRVGHS